MVTSEIQTTQVEITSENLTIPAYLAVPQGEGPFPAVVVLQEIFGVNAHIRSITERLAQAGYVAIAPALYQRLAPNFEAGYTPADIAIGRQYKEQTKAAELLADIQGAIAHVQKLPMVKGKSCGCIGFCFGGHVAYLAATLPDIQATASFYGAGITTWTPGGQSPTVELTADIKGPLYAFFGMEDASIPTAQVNQIEAELQRYQVPHQVFRYDGADHGFFCDQRASYNLEAAADAWEKVKQLFHETL
ncbi:MAG: dienelactone hydrolase family protein [Cyanothece sp. SIO1E1]|nr:dienelactone hydrolase family protein [Cyanothece sp. SIO1E1]